MHNNPADRQLYPVQSMIEASFLMMGLSPWQAKQGWDILRDNPLPMTPNEALQMLRQGYQQVTGREYCEGIE